MSNAFYNLLSQLYYNDDYVFLINGSEAHVEKTIDGYCIVHDIMGNTINDIENEKWLNERVLLTFYSKGERFELTILKRAYLSKRDFT